MYDTNYRLFLPYALGVGCAYDLPLPNFQFEFKSNHCKAMKYKRRRYNLRRTKNVKYHIRPSQRVSDRNGLRSRVTKGRNP
jgi:hypothetical protein